MITLCLQNIKGGVFKTGISIHLAAAFAQSKKPGKPRVLLVDCDSQSSIKTYFKLKLPERDFSDFLIHGADYRDCLKEVILRDRSKIDVLLSSRKLADADIKMQGFPRREDTLLLRFQDQAISNDYDLVIFDCPPTLNLVTLNVLRFSDYLLIPSTADALSMSGITTILDNIKFVKKYWNHEPHLLGVIPTNFDSRLKIHQQFLEGMKSIYKNVRFYKAIRNDVKVPNAAARKKTVFEYAPKARAAEDLLKLHNDVFKDIEKLKTIKSYKPTPHETRSELEA